LVVVSSSIAWTAYNHIMPQSALGEATYEVHRNTEETEAAEKSTEEEQSMMPSLPMPEGRLRFTTDPRQYDVRVLPKTLSCRQP